MSPSASPPVRRHWLLSGATPLTLAMTAISALYLISAFQMAPPLDNGRLTASFFPVLIGSIALVLCVAQLVSQQRASRDSRSSKSDSAESTSTETANNDASSADSDASSPRFSPALRLMLVTALYILAFSHLGYLLSSALYVFAVMLLFAGRDKWVSKAVIACAISALGYGLFEQLFNVHLPALDLSALGLGNGS
ncbi:MULTISPECIES: tripartite tricarboxylate transporter TctB family protein [unclassified Cobetia]|uniref:tripartite tricarboxylate transporter TctB family protein n=1 Tax=unclassified Cobetia TaxID=2609414 RepID=UPI00178C9E04|nr:MULTISPECIES: tripartite tricarboxylate transporter TctB family protein [unclassified Cobetia]MBE2169907.1 tripartite tricarboxylate transporter TctB family protein [Cobetia sp. 2AS1]MDH2446909.1 tripartite tricarboxylate transporter TctB family protein [Cobetia sp. 2AS]